MKSPGAGSNKEPGLLGEGRAFGLWLMKVEHCVKAVLLVGWCGHRRGERWLQQEGVGEGERCSEAVLLRTLAAGTEWTLVKK